MTTTPATAPATAVSPVVDTVGTRRGGNVTGRQLSLLTKVASAA